MENKREKGSVSVGLLAHVDAGKTTLSECLLYHAGKLRAMGRVDHGSTYLDTDQMEKERGITIFAKQAVFDWGDTHITLLDTPGHVDFSAETERTLQVLDLAVLLISGSDGVQGHTKTLWKLLARHQIPVLLFINKMDLAGTDKEKLMTDLQQHLSDGCMDFSGAPDEEYYENLAMTDEAAMEEYLEVSSLSGDTIKRLVSQRRVFPCYFGSALKDEGVEALLDGIARFRSRTGKTGEFGARVFKISRDDKGARLTHMKVTAGSLKVKSLINGEKADQLRIYSGNSFTPVQEIFAGDVCAVTGLSATFAGQGLGIEKDKAANLLQPVLSYTLQLDEDCDVHRLLQNLRLLEEEDPTLHVVWEEKNREIRLQLMGQVQLEILKRIILDRFGVRVNFGTGRIVYKETIEDEVEGIGHFEPLRHYAECHLLLQPGEPGSGIALASACSEDVLDLNWQRLILTHLGEKEHVGVLTGSPITDIRITLLTGRAHTKHTEGGDFRQATYRALRQGLMQAKSRLLEPWYSFSLEVPQENVGRAMADIQRMSGRFEGPEISGETAVLTGEAPVSKLQEYMTEIHAYTRGRGRLSCTLKGYEPCHNEEEVLANTVYDPEADLENTPDSVFCAHGAGFIVKWDKVPEYAQVDSGWRKEIPEETQELSSVRMPDNEPVAKDHSLYGSWKQDRELEEIFSRTFGSKGERRIPSYHRVSFGRAQTEANVEATRAYKEAHMKEPTDGRTYFLVDGYNIIFAWEELKEVAQVNLDGARFKLLDMLCNYQGFTGYELICVFDAYKVKGHNTEVEKYHNIHVVYTKEAQTADAYIEKTSRELARHHRVRVATSDALEQLIVMGGGAVRVSAAELYEEMKEAVRQMADYYQDREERLRNRPFEDMPDPL